MREVERYPLDIVRLARMHSLGSVPLLLERGWTLYFSDISSGDSSVAMR